MKKSTSGFTLIELIVTLGIFIVISGFVFINIAGRRSQTDLLDATDQIGALLREAQLDSTAQKNNASWGVYFANSTATSPFYVLFTNTYSVSNTIGYYILPASVSYNTATLASGATSSVTFSQVTGMASASTSIGLYMPKQSVSFSSTISIASSGAISY
jgi:prepilin-type N-terminal cleavage/methylation domain-containing protein